MNNLFQQLNPVRPLPNNIVNAIKTLKTIKNPTAYAHQVINSNPQLQSLLQASNGNYEQAFKTLAKQMNVNPDDVINLLK